jgi:hypothetical protein
MADGGTHVNSFIASIGHPVDNVDRRGHNAMTQSAKRFPAWLTFDVLVIVISLVIIGIGIGIGVAP